MTAILGGVGAVALGLIMLMRWRLNRAQRQLGAAREERDQAAAELGAATQVSHNQQAGRRAGEEVRDAAAAAPDHPDRAAARARMRARGL